MDAIKPWATAQEEARVAQVGRGTLVNIYRQVSVGKALL